MSIQREQFRLLDVKLDLLDLAAAVRRIDQWAGRGRTRYVCACNVHSIMTAQRDRRLMSALNGADLTLPDGMPLVWAARRFGHDLAGRAYGPALMRLLCARAAERRLSVFLLGSSPAVNAALAARLRVAHPGLRIVGRLAPDAAEVAAGSGRLAAQVNAVVPDILWVGLGCPKQELWMYENRSRLHGAVAIGVGAAFDFLAGAKRQAPGWMGDRGLEWLFRLLCEPGRLSGRYLECAPFIPRVLRQWKSHRRAAEEASAPARKTTDSTR